MGACLAIQNNDRRVHPGLRTSQLRICIMTAFQQPPCAPSTISNIFHLVLGEWHHPSVLEWWPVWALVWAFKTGHSILWHVLYMYVYFKLSTDGRPAVQPALSKPQRTSSLKELVAIQSDPLPEVRQDNFHLELGTPSERSG